MPTVAWVDTAAIHEGEPLYRVIADVEGAAAEIERLFEDDAYHRRAGERARAYFAATHSREEVLARYGQLLRELTERPEAVA